MTTSVFLLMASFVLSLAGLFVFIASMTRGLFGSAEQGSRVIFAADEENVTEDPAASPTDQARLQAEVRVAAPASSMEISRAALARVRRGGATIGRPIGEAGG